MDVTLGPFKNAMATQVTKLDSLAAAMHDQAFDTAKAMGFTANEAKDGVPAAKGFTISGKITSVSVDENKRTQVVVAFTILVDGTFSNTILPPSRGYAEGASRAEDVVQALTESAITKFLKAVKAGQVLKAR